MAFMPDARFVESVPCDWVLMRRALGTKLATTLKRGGSGELPPLPPQEQPLLPHVTAPLVLPTPRAGRSPVHQLPRTRMVHLNLWSGDFRMTELV